MVRQDHLKRHLMGICMGFHKAHMKKSGVGRDKVLHVNKERKRKDKTSWTLGALRHPSIPAGLTTG